MVAVFSPKDILIDNTLLTAGTRALNQGPRCSDFDFLALVELSQDLICYEHLVMDATSRQSSREEASWDQATSPWGAVQKYAIRRMEEYPDLSIREEMLDGAVRIALTEACAGTYTQVYRDACLSIQSAKNKNEP
jgi:hypothetical protein